MSKWVYIYGDTGCRELWFQFQAEEFCVLNSLNLGQRWIWGSYTLYLLYLTLYLLVVIGLSITWIKSCIYCLMSSFGMWEWPQKQAPEMALKKDPDKNFAIFTGKHLHQSLFFSKVAGLSLQLYQKKRLRCRYFIVFKNTYFAECLPTTGSVELYLLFLLSIH